MKKIFSRLPRKVLVDGVPYKISYLKKVEGGDKWGTCDLVKKVVKVQKTDKRIIMEKTLIHEILHAMAEEGYFDLSEEKVRKLENSLHKLFAENNWKIQL
jgi:hypothetical protein